MKRTKKLLALALALAMAFTTLVMPAMAAENRSFTINTNCNTCGGYRNFTRVYDGPMRSKIITVGGCSKTNFSHQHKLYYYDAHYECNDCGSQTLTHIVPAGEDCYYNG